MLSIDSVWVQLTTGDKAPIFYIAFFIIIPVGLLTSLVAIAIIFRKLNAKRVVFPEMRKVHQYIRSGAQTYLKRQAKTLIILVSMMYVPVGFTGFSFMSSPVLAVLVTGGVYALGALSSLLAGYISMDAATRANILVIEAASEQTLLGFKKGYFAGMISGILNMSVFLLAIWILFIVTQGNIRLITSFSFGASTAALLAQVGGGIFTKSADMGADLVGKFEIGIEEDDPSNPAIIADAVGDNVGDCAGRGADLFETATSDAVGGMVLGFTLATITGNPIFIITNITLLSLGNVSAFVSCLFLNADIERSPSRVVWKVFTVATVVNFGVLFLVMFMMFGFDGYMLFFSCIFGLIACLLSVVIVIIYTEAKYKPTFSIAEASQEGPAINAVRGLAIGIESVMLPLVVFGTCVVFAYMFGFLYGVSYSASNGDGGVDQGLFTFIFGIWGVALASVSSDMIISTILSFDTFGPVMDNAAGITQMVSNEGPSYMRAVLDKLDATGNTTKAIAKGFALVCGSLSSFVLFQTFILDTYPLSTDLPSIFIFPDQVSMELNVNLTNPLVIIGLIIGTGLPFLFASQVLKAVGKGAREMVREVRRQFDSIPGLRDGNAVPEYNKCIDISAKNAIKSMVFPVMIIIVVPVSFGILFGPFAMGGFLVGNLIGGLIVGLFMTLGGGAFDNAKKAIEAGLFGGKGTPTHKAAIIGDTIGDPLKDSAGPSMNIQIKLVNTLALTFLPLFVMTGWGWSLVPFF